MRGVDVLLVVVLMTLAAGLLAFLPGAFSVDSWLALVTGREIWQTGLPHHEVLTAMSHGSNWVDQQWLAQLTTYGLYLLAGACWVPVVIIQMRMKVMLEAQLRGEPFNEAAYNRLFRVWFALGWPAFGGLLVIFWLMVTKPTW